jgi:serine/threonine-protein kinase RsbW
LLRQAAFVIRATLSEVSVLGETLHVFRGVHAAEGVADNIELGIVEALTNVVEHGHAGGADATIEILYQELAGLIMVEIVDRGQATPLTCLGRDDAFDFDAAIHASLPEGGMGLALIERSFDSIDYNSSAGKNRLLLTKSLG